MIGRPVAASSFFGRGRGEERKIVERQYVWVFVDEMVFLVWILKSDIVYLVRWPSQL